MSVEHLRPYLELEGLCSRPVFIIGSPRSGTTVLGHALNQHPDFWASNESYVLHQLYGMDRARYVWKHHQERKNPSWLRAQQVDRAEFLGFLGLGVNAMYSSRSGGARWVDPTPLNTLMVDDLVEMFPSASFVHILRDGRFVVRSMGRFLDMMEAQSGFIPDDEVPGWTHDFQRACETWAKYVDTASALTESHPERCLTVRNEDLTADPEDGFARIHEFLGASADHGPASFFAHERVNSSFRGEKPRDDDWSDWGGERRRQFAQIAGATLIRIGYTTPEGLEAWTESGSLAPARGAPGRGAG